MRRVHGIGAGAAALLLVVAATQDAGAVARPPTRPAPAAAPVAVHAAAPVVSDAATTPDGPVGALAAALTVSKTVTPNPLTVGGTGTYTVVITNTGDEPAADVTLSDTLDPGVTVGALPPGCSASGQIVTCGAGALPPGGSTTVEIPFTVDPSLSDGYNVVNRAEATSSTGSGGSTQLITQAQTLADVTITKDGPATVHPDGTITWSFAVTNLGPSDAVDVTVQDPTDGNLTTIVDRPAECPGGGLTITCPLGTLSPGQTETFTVTVAVNAGVPLDTVITNCATVYTGTRESDPDNNRSCVDTIVSPPQPPSPTPTPSPTITPTPTVTPTPTPTVTPTPTGSPTVTPSSSPTYGPAPWPTRTGGGHHLPVTGFPVPLAGGLALTLLVAGLLLRRLARR